MDCVRQARQAYQQANARAVDALRQSHAAAAGFFVGLQASQLWAVTSFSCPSPCLFYTENQ